MTRKTLTTIIFSAAVAALIGACEPGSSDQSLQCPGGCPFGQLCQRGRCENPGGGQDNPSQPSQPSGPQCAAPMQACGNRCVDLQSDKLNCGGCGAACGASSDCVFGQCQCLGSAKDCNGQRIDGCECQACDSSDPSKCKTAPACDPTQAGSCAGDGMYCTNTVTGSLACQTCPAGYSNCDGVGNCECSGGCNGGQCAGGSGSCDPSKTNSCGASGAFCDTGSKACANCQAGYSNCDGQWGCECNGTCNGTQCVSNNSNSNNQPPPSSAQCDTNQRNACGDSQFYCDPATSTCKNCDSWFSSKRNCDGVGGCETSGTTCQNTLPSSGYCSDQVAWTCGDDTYFCNKNTGGCERCAAYTRNCNGLQICEHPGTSCSGSSGGSTSGNYDIVAYSVKVSSKNSSGSDWDTLPWVSPPDPYMRLTLGSSAKSSSSHSDTTSATFDETLLSNVSALGKTLRIDVRDWDNVSYETMGSCSVYLSSSKLSSGSAVVTYCGGSSVPRVEVRFRRR